MKFITVTELIKTNNETVPIRESPCLLNADSIMVISQSEMSTAVGAHIIGLTKTRFVSHIGLANGRMVSVKESHAEILHLISQKESNAKPAIAAEPTA